MHLNFPLIHVLSAAWSFQGWSQQAGWPRVGEEETVFPKKPGWEVRPLRTANASICTGHHFAYQRVGKADQTLQFFQSMEKDTPSAPLRLGLGGLLLCAGKIFGKREVRNKKSEGSCKEEGSEKVEDENWSQMCGRDEVPWSEGLRGRNGLSPFPFSLLVLYMHVWMDSCFTVLC